MRPEMQMPSLRKDLWFLHRSPMRNGWASIFHRIHMAWACLRGDSVVFNTRFYLKDDMPVQITPIAPGAQLWFHSNLTYIDPESDGRVRITIGERIDEQN